MWDLLKTALLGIKDAAGIEIPGLQTEFGSVTESAESAVQGAIDTAADTFGAATTSTADAITGLPFGDIKSK